VPKCCADKSCQNYNPIAYSDAGTCVLKTAMFNDQYRKDVDIARCFSWFLQDLVHYRILSCLVSCIGYWGLESFTKMYFYSISGSELRVSHYWVERFAHEKMLTPVPTFITRELLVD